MLKPILRLLGVEYSGRAGAELVSRRGFLVGNFESSASRARVADARHNCSGVGRHDRHMPSSQHY